MMRVIGNDQNLPRQEHALASGAITNGATIVVNADGTVSAVSGADTGAGSNAQITSATTSFIEATYDTNSDKVVVAYQASSNYGRARVGTISGSSVTFGTEVVFQSSQTSVHGITFDSNANKIVILYEDGGDGDSLQAIVGTVSGTDISFGTRVEIASSGGDGKITFDSNANKVLASYKSGSTTYAVVGTVSGTSISFGSAATLISAQAPIKAQVFDSNANKHLIAYSDGDSSNFGSKVATISGTSVSFGSEVSIGQNPSGNNGAGVFDPDNNKVVVFYPDRANSTYGTARVGTISGTSISYGTAVVFNSDTTNWVGATYDTATNKIVVVYQADNSDRISKVRTAEVSGTSITFNSDTITLESGTGGNGQRYFAPVYDPDQDKTFIAYRDGSRSEHAYAKIYTVGSTNITSENYIGIANSGAADGAGAIIDTQGAIADNLSSLTAGQSYFVQTDGTLGTTADDPSVFAGTAVSATKLIVKG